MSVPTGMSWGVVLFTTFGGLRGAVSLILAQILVLDQEQKVVSSRHITAEVRRSCLRFTKLPAQLVRLQVSESIGNHHQIMPRSREWGCLHSSLTSISPIACRWRCGPPASWCSRSSSTLRSCHGC